MPTTCFTPILGKRLRATVLGAGGSLPAAAAEDSMAVTDGFMSVTLSSEAADGTEIITKKADGSLCVNEQGDSSFKRFTLAMEFCGVDPGLLSVVTNAEIYENYEAIASGIVVPEGVLNKRFALELWTGLSGGAPGAEGEEASGYLLLPFVASGMLGDISIDGENAVTFSLTSSFTKGGNQWGRGPYNVMTDPEGGGAGIAGPGLLPTALDPLDHLLLVETGIAPPASVCGLQAMPPLA